MSPARSRFVPCLVRSIFSRCEVSARCARAFSGFVVRWPYGSIRLQEFAHSSRAAEQVRFPGVFIGRKGDGCSGGHFKRTEFRLVGLGDGTPSSGLSLLSVVWEKLSGQCPIFSRPVWLCLFSEALSSIMSADFCSFAGLFVRVEACGAVVFTLQFRSHRSAEMQMSEECGSIEA